MPIKVLMPALSPTMTEGKLAKWVVKEGDTVDSGDVMAEIETDKATMEVEAVDEGVIGKILVAEGTDNVAVNEVIALLLEDGEDESALDGADTSSGCNPAAAPTEKEKPAAAAEEKSAPAEEALRRKPLLQRRLRGDRIFASPLARRIAGQEGLDLAKFLAQAPKVASSNATSKKRSNLAPPKRAQMHQQKYIKPMHLLQLLHRRGSTLACWNCCQITKKFQIPDAQDHRQTLDSSSP